MPTNPVTQPPTQSPTQPPTQSPTLTSCVPLGGKCQSANDSPCCRGQCIKGPNGPKVCVLP